MKTVNSPSIWLSVCAWLLLCLAGCQANLTTEQQTPAAPLTTSTVATFDRPSVEQHLIATLGSKIKQHPLRQEYEQRVTALSSYADQITPDMPLDQLKALAQQAHQARRDLGVQYKHLTPEPLRDYIYAINQQRYGDPLGPTFDYLLQQGRTYTDIIQSSARPNPNVDQLLGKFGEWLQQQPDDYVKNAQAQLNTTP